MLMSAFFEVKNRICLSFFYKLFKMIYNCTCFYICIVNISRSNNEKAFITNSNNFGKSQKLLLSETMR